MTSIVLDLQRDALDPNIRASDLLRKALVVAKKLGIADFEIWASRELNGYTDDKDIPSYRLFQGEIEAWNPYHGWVPVMFQDSKLAEALSTCATSQSVGEIEAVVSGLTLKTRLTVPFEKDLEYKLIRGMSVKTQISRRVPAARVIGILDAVRNIILNWSLKLEQDGIVGEGLAFSNREKEVAAKGVYLVNNFYASATVQQGNISSNQITAQNDVTIGGDVTGRDKTS